jgi:hypothetical protein
MMTEADLQQLESKLIGDAGISDHWAREATYMALQPSDVRALIAEVRRLRQIIDGWPKAR